MCDEATDCACRRTVTRIYRELRDRNLPDLWAFDTAATIFRLHHPEVGEREARFTVADWLEGIA